MINEFKNYLRQQGIQESTIRIYASAMKQLLDSKKDPLDRLLTQKKWSRQTLEGRKAALKWWAQFTADDELLARVNSAATARVVKRLKRSQDRGKVVQPLPKATVQRLLSEIEELSEDEDIPIWQWAAPMLMIKLGLRAGADLVRISRDSVLEALNSGFLTLLTKGGKERALDISMVQEELTALLAEDWEELEDLISPHAKKVSRTEAAYKAVQRHFKALAEQIGLDPAEMHTHRLRHTAANLLWERTKDLVLVSRFLGHTSIMTTEKYLKAARIAEVGAAAKGLYDDDE